MPLDGFRRFGKMRNVWLDFIAHAADQLHVNSCFLSGQITSKYRKGDQKQRFSPDECANRKGVNNT